MVVRRPATKFDLRVVVICGSLQSGSNARPILAHRSPRAMGSAPDSTRGLPLGWFFSRIASLDSKIARRRPILRVEMRRKNLLTQVLIANLLLMVVAVVATGIAGNLSLDLADRPELAL